jgi:hypothetical protein
MQSPLMKFFGSLFNVIKSHGKIQGLNDRKKTNYKQGAQQRIKRRAGKGREGKERKGESETIANQEYFSVTHLIDGNTIGVVYFNVVLIMVDTSLTRLH